MKNKLIKLLSIGIAFIMVFTFASTQKSIATDNTEVEMTIEYTPKMWWPTMSSTGWISIYPKCEGAKKFKFEASFGQLFFKQMPIPPSNVKEIEVNANDIKNENNYVGWNTYLPLDDGIGKIILTVTAYDSDSNIIATEEMIIMETVEYGYGMKYGVYMPVQTDNVRSLGSNSTEIMKISNDFRNIDKSYIEITDSEIISKLNEYRDSEDIRIPSDEELLDSAPLYWVVYPDGFIIGVACEFQCRCGEGDHTYGRIISDEYPQGCDMILPKGMFDYVKSVWDKNVQPPSICECIQPNGTVGVPYTGIILGTGNPFPVFSITSGALPDGLSIGKDGIIRGTPTKAGSFEFTFKAINCFGEMSAGNRIIINPPIREKGDINGDGKINGMDLLLLKQHILEVEGKTIGENTEAFRAADMNDDGKINGMDLLLLKKLILQGTSKNNPYYPDEILNLASTECYNTLITKTISNDDIFQKGLMRKFNHSYSFLIDIEYYNDTFGIECLRKINDERVYAIQKTDDGALVYTFFEKGILFDSIIASKSLSYTDFTGVEEGSHISVVENIDPVTALYKDIALKDNARSFISLHLLKDGILSLNFQLKYDKAENQYIYKVADIQYFDDFITEYVSVQYPEGDLNYHFDYSILDQDYPR